jgi:ABC-type branched-subunit amino acid transport system substrate-binding protein
MMSPVRGRPVVVLVLTVMLSAALAMAGTPALAAKPKGPPIVIGMYTPVAGNAAGVAYPYAVSAVNAAIRAANKAGDLKQPIQLDFCDPKEDPTEAAKCARQFVDDKVAAVVGSFSQLGGSAIQPVLVNAGIANFGVYPLAGGDLSATVAFPIVGGSLPVYASGPTVLAKAGAHKIFVPHLDSAAAQAVVTYVKAGAKSVTGSEVVGDIGIPATAPDLAPFVAAAKSAGADAAVLALSEPLAVKYIQAAASAGIKMKFVYVGFTPEAIAQLGPLANGVLTPMPLPPDTAATRKLYPEMNTFNADMAAQAKTGDKYAKIKNTHPAHTLRAWVAMRQLVQVLKKIPAGSEITAATVLNQINQTPQFDIGFKLPPVKFPGPVATFPRITDYQIFNVIIKKNDYVLQAKQPINTLTMFTT